MLKKSASMVGLSLMLAACSGGGGAGPSGAGGAGPGGGGGSGGSGGQGGGGPVCGALFPQDANLVDVKAAYGAKGDGITDDTAALKKAIAENVGYHRTLLLPTGTYLVRDQLDFRDTEGRWRSYLSLQGEGAGCTVLKLADAAEGFGDAMAPKPVLRPGSKTDDPACSNVGQDDGDGGGNCAFGNYVLDLTVDTGSQNAGAVGIDFIASNWGAVKNVDIVSGDGGGAVGLRLTREVGPALIKGVRVDGFRVGIEASRDLYGITLEHITLRRQTEAGIKNQGNMLAIRGLKSDNKVPAVVNEDPLGLVALIDSALEGGAAERAAVENSGVMLARGLTTAGYGAAIRMGNTEVPAGAVDEWLSHPPLELFSTSKQSLRLPVEETPTFAAPLEAWANVEAFGAKRDDDVDDADALQAAIDSGKPVVYLPFGRYVLNKTVQVRGAVRRIVAFQSVLGGSAAPMLRVEGVDGPSVILERARGLEGGVEHASPAALAVVHAVDVRLLPPAPGAGPLFLEDTCCKNFVTGKRPVWARQLNVESGITPQIDNAGGTLWILGMKTEGTHTNLRTAEGGKTELLGAMFYGTGGPNEPAVVVEGASVSLTYTEVAYTDVTDYDVHVRQTQGGQTKDLGQDALVWRGYGGMMPLFVSQP